jgi:hypothetical protein
MTQCLTRDYMNLIIGCYKVLPHSPHRCHGFPSNDVQASCHLLHHRASVAPCRFFVGAAAGLAIDTVRAKALKPLVREVRCTLLRHGHCPEFHQNLLATLHRPSCRPLSTPCPHPVSAVAPPATCPGAAPSTAIPFMPTFSGEIHSLRTLKRGSSSSPPPEGGLAVASRRRWRLPAGQPPWLAEQQSGAAPILLSRAC